MSRLRDAVQGRHRAVQDAARWLEVDPALPAALAAVAGAFESLSLDLLAAIGTDDPELTRCLATLTQAKDHAVRAAIADGYLDDA